MHVRVAVPDPVMLAALMFPQLRPFGTESVRATAPVNPLRAVIVMVVDPDWPALVTVGVDAIIVKSGWFILKDAIAECVREPLIPVTISV